MPALFEWPWDWRSPATFAFFAIVASAIGLLSLAYRGVLASENPLRKILPLPFHAIDGIYNVRDVGGYPIQQNPGYMLRRGKIFRGAEPSQVTVVGIRTLDKLGITTFFDLRAPDEIVRHVKRRGERYAPRDVGRTRRISVPVFQEGDYTDENLGARFHKYTAEGTAGFVANYKEILLAGCSPENVAQPWRTIISHLAAENACVNSVFIHCAWGKDRTALICALIQSACGVSDEDIAEDYILTAQGLAELEEEVIQELLGFGCKHGIEKTREEVIRMVIPRKEVMLATLTMIRETWGSPTGFLINQCGVKPIELSHLRRNLVVNMTG